MARDRLWKTLDAALTWHPDDCNEVVTGSSNSCIQTQFTFTGVAAHAMNDFLLPLYQGEAFSPGSTDVGDVSWLCPTAQIHVAAYPNGTPGHSWQVVSD